MNKFAKQLPALLRARCTECGVTLKSGFDLTVARPLSGEQLVPGITINADGYYHQRISIREQAPVRCGPVSIETERSMTADALLDSIHKVTQGTTFEDDGATVTQYVELILKERTALR